MPQGIICFLLCQYSEANMYMIYFVSCVSVYYSVILLNMVVGVVRPYTEKYAMGNSVLLLVPTPKA